MDSRAKVNRPACATFSDIFCHPLLEDAPANLSPAERQLRSLLASRACALCARCPISHQCLYDAVVRFDVAGIVAGTTPAMRQAIRQRLGWHIEPDNFDNLLGVSNGAHVEHDDIVRARRSNPTESLNQLAEHLGCSLSTVKRHLRQERSLAARPKLSVVPPSYEQVAQALQDVLASRRLINRQTANRELVVAA